MHLVPNLDRESALAEPPRRPQRPTMPWPYRERLSIKLNVPFDTWPSSPAARQVTVYLPSPMLPLTTAIRDFSDMECVGPSSTLPDGPAISILLTDTSGFSSNQS